MDVLGTIQSDKLTTKQHGQEGDALSHAHRGLGGTSSGSGGRAVVFKMRKTAYVDLSHGTTEVVETSRDRLDEFLGGRGYGASLLYDLVPPGVALLDPGNAVVLTSGLFSNTPWPAASRYHLTFRSPLTGCYGYANAGGKLGPSLAACGFGAVVVRGRAETPVHPLAGRGSVATLPAGALQLQRGRGPRPGEGRAMMRPTSPQARDPCVGGGGPTGAGRGIIGGSGTLSNREGDGDAVP